MASPSFSTPIPGLAPVESLTWTIPGLREDPTLCLRCRSAQLLCGKPVCPILVKYRAFERTLAYPAPRPAGGDAEPEPPRFRRRQQPVDDANGRLAIHPNQR